MDTCGGSLPFAQACTTRPLLPWHDRPIRYLSKDRNEHVRQVIRFRTEEALQLGRYCQDEARVLPQPSPFVTFWELEMSTCGGSIRISAPMPP